MSAFAFSSRSLSLSSTKVHRGKHRFGVVGKVTALSVQAFARDVRSAHALISGSELGFFREFLQFFDDRLRRAGETSADRADVVVENEEFEFLAELAMVALLRFLEHCEIVVELLSCS